MSSSEQLLEYEEQEKKQMIHEFLQLHKKTKKLEKKKALIYKMLKFECMVYNRKVKKKKKLKKKYKVKQFKESSKIFDYFFDDEKASKKNEKPVVLEKQKSKCYGIHFFKLP